VNGTVGGMYSDELIRGLDRLKAIMISVATGGPRIAAVQEEFVQLYDEVSRQLETRRIPNPLPYRDLWEWYGRWSSGDMPTWRSRRDFVNELFRGLVENVRKESGRRNAAELVRPQQAAKPSHGMPWDVFVSHATEDKDSFARPLAERLRQRGYAFGSTNLLLPWVTVCGGR
jgi:hypothetical protein